MEKKRTIFERRWTGKDGIDWAHELATRKLHPSSVSAMMPYGYRKEWFESLIAELTRLAYRKRIAKTKPAKTETTLETSASET